MTRRSVYWGADCMNCGQRITAGRSFIGMTYYVTEHKPHDNGLFRRPRVVVTSYSVTDALRRNHSTVLIANETRVRIAYHRKCVEAVLAKAPLDKEEAELLLREYRDGLLEQLGMKDETQVLAPELCDAGVAAPQPN